MPQILNSIENVFNQYAPCVFVEVIKATSGTPCKAGFKMIVNKEGRVEGSVGGGVLELSCIDIAKKMIENDEKTNIYKFSLQNDLPVSKQKLDINGKETSGKDDDIDDGKNTKGKDTNVKDNSKDNDKDISVNFISNEKNDEANMLNGVCGGVVEIFFELYLNKTIYIFGAGHIGKALVEIFDGLDYKINVFDIRKDFLSEFSSFNNVECFELSTDENDEKFFVGKSPLNDLLQSKSYVIITTHGHTYDYSIAKYILASEKNFKYIGMIGSKNKVKIFFKNLKEKDKENFERLKNTSFYSPIGLDIGGVSAKEVALSIAAQIQAIRYDKNQNNLSIIQSLFTEQD